MTYWKSGVASKVGSEIEPSDACETLVAISSRTRLAARVTGQAPDVPRDKSFGRAARFAGGVRLHEQAAFALETLKLGRARAALASLVAGEALIQRLLVVEASAAVRHAETIRSESEAGWAGGAAVDPVLCACHAFDITVEALVACIVIILV